jgi:hypothetical protein
MKSGRGSYDHTKEWHGPSYQMLMSDQRQEGDPGKVPPGLPPGYRRPMSVMDLIVAGAPRVLPVSQAITHGPEQSRGAEFDEAVQAAADLGALHFALGFRDRRYEGGRHRPTDNVEDLTPQEPPQRGWQADVPFERYLSY